MNFNGTNLAIILVAVILLVGIFAALQYSDQLRTAWSRISPPTIGHQPTSGESLFNTSFLLAVVFWLAVGYFVGVPISRWIAGGLGLRGTLVLHSAVTLAIATLGMLWVTHNTPTNHKTAVFFFKTARFRVGPRNNGFEEGLNALPLGWPFFVAQDRNVNQFVEKFDQMKAYSKDRQPVKISGTFRRYIDDIYASYNINNADGAETEAVEELVSTTLGFIRDGADEYTAIQLISEHPNGSGPTKKVLAESAYEKALAYLAGINTIGYRITPILINEIDLDADFEKALKAKSREEQEGEAEQVQIERRLKQIDTLKAKGVNADLAVAAAQVEAEKPGAKINTINIPGMQGIGEAAGNAGKAFSDWLRNKTT